MDRKHNNTQNTVPVRRVKRGAWVEGRSQGHSVFIPSQSSKRAPYRSMHTCSRVAKDWTNVSNMKQTTLYRDTECMDIYHHAT
jgi:hypothetical protein